MTETETAQASTRETFSFQAEVQQILHLMIHSLYSEREIFLRELISNASDAIDRLRFESLTDNALIEDEDEREIRITVDKDNSTITIHDNGIGMSRDEVMENIGTIARSGTRRFLDSLTGKDKDDARLIGQFGVGFYSAFMVAEKVTLETRKAGAAKDQGVYWESDGSGSYALETVDRDDHGTTVTLHLRESEKEFLEPHRLRSIVSRYSDHISLPIRMLKAPTPKSEDAEEAAPVEDEWETVNSGSALWARAKKDVTQEEYDTFYRTLSFDSDSPLSVLHSRVEGKSEYTSLLFIPKRAPFDLWDRDRRHGVKLYVRRVFIMDDTKHLLPAYLRFVRGVVDSADLPLNVSREFLQRNDQIDRIRAASVKKILGELKRIAEDETETYAAFWKEFGKVMKEGIVEDTDNREALLELVRFASTHDDTDEQKNSLADYHRRMPLKQKAIYYLTAETWQQAKDSPHLEVFRKKGVEVLLLTDPVDEWLVGSVGEYKDKPLKSVARGGLDDEGVADAEDSKVDERKSEFEPLLARLKDALGDRVKDVRLSKRLTDSPTCLIADEHDLGGNLERILKAMGQDAPMSKPIMEVNPDHGLISHLRETEGSLDDWANVLFDQAALAEGATLVEPASYVRRINRLLEQQFAPLDSGDRPVEEQSVPLDGGDESPSVLAPEWTEEKAEADDEHAEGEHKTG